MENKQTLDFDKICQWFKDGEKKRENWLIGTEHEKFLFKKNEFKRLSYEDLKGIKFILNKIAEEEDWEKISENNNLIGLKHRSGSSISLEPGGQFELSGAPLKNLHMTCNEAGLHLNLMKKISNELETSDGFIMIVPEYGGMATPNSKNMFLLFNGGELFHKPGLIVSISSGKGGSYPISELRSSSYKNSHIMWIPENIIIRNVE